MTVTRIRDQKKKNKKRISIQRENSDDSAGKINVGTSSKQKKGYFHMNATKKKNEFVLMGLYYFKYRLHETVPSKGSKYHTISKTVFLQQLHHHHYKHE